MDNVTNTVLTRNEAKVLEDAVALKIAGITIDYENKSCEKILLIIITGLATAKKSLQIMFWQISVR